MTAAPGWYRWDGDNLILHLQIQPRSSKDSFGEIHNNRLKLRLTAAPVDGKANQRLLGFLAKQFGIPKAAVSIVAGESSRLKTVVLQNPAKTPEKLDLRPETAKNC